MIGDGSRDLVRTLLERLPFAAALTDSCGNLHVINTSAQTNLCEGTDFREVGGRLCVQCDLAQRSLNALFAECSTCEDSSATIVIKRQRTQSFWLLTVCSLPETAIASGRMISWFDPSDPRLLSGEALQSVYGLSPTEAKVAVALSAGMDLATLSKDLGMQPETARSHLKSVFRKMGVHRQQDLVRTVTLVGLIR